MTRTTWSLVVFIFLIFWAADIASCFKFDLDARSFQCFSEDLVPKFDVSGIYTAAPGFSQFIDFRVRFFLLFDFFFVSYFYLSPFYFIPGHGSFWETRN